MGVAPDEKPSIANYVVAGIRCGLSLRETLQAPVGLMQDIWELNTPDKGNRDE